MRATGEERWLIVRPSPITDPDTGALPYAVNVFENITEVKRAQLAESFMAEASRVLASSMDYAETLKRVARLAVPQIADWCAVDVLGRDGEIERVAVHHADPGQARARRAAGPRLPTSRRRAGRRAGGDPHRAGRASSRTSRPTRSRPTPATASTCELLQRDRRDAP